MILLIRRLEHSQPIHHRWSRCDDEEILGKSFVPRVNHFVQDVPCRDHRHHNRFSRPGRHLGTQPSKIAAVIWNLHAKSFGGR